MWKMGVESEKRCGRWVWRVRRDAEGWWGSGRWVWRGKEVEGECGEWGGGHGEGKWNVGVEKMGWRGR